MLLLKLKHIFFIFFNYNDIKEIISADAGLVVPSRSMSVKVYYELMDNMVILPNKCINETNLEKCIYKNANKVFNHVSMKYNLTFSKSG